MKAPSVNIQRLERAFAVEKYGVDTTNLNKEPMACTWRGCNDLLIYSRLRASRAKATDFSMRAGSSRTPPTLMRKKASPFRT